MHEFKQLSHSFTRYGKNLPVEHKFDSLTLNERTNVSDMINKDQNIKIENISYNFYVGNELYITKISDYDYMIELSIPNVELLIPPFDESSKFRINSNEQILKNIYFNAILNLN